jgi:hypothetical protein
MDETQIGELVSAVNRAADALEDISRKICDEDDDGRIDIWKILRDIEDRSDCIVDPERFTTVQSIADSLEALVKMYSRWK